MALFTTSTYGNPMLMDREGYTYQKHLKNANTNLTHWKCSKAKRGFCPARASTAQNFIVKRVGPHNHFPK